MEGIVVDEEGGPAGRGGEMEGGEGGKKVFERGGEDFVRWRFSFFSFFFFLFSFPFSFSFFFFLTLFLFLSFSFSVFLVPNTSPSRAKM